jgi:hypothetical protein
LTEFYQELYQLGSKLNKRDKLGIYLKTENICLEALALIIEASFLAKPEKQKPLATVRVKIEILKHLVRLAWEQKIIESHKYLNLQAKLQEVSKMAAGWLKYTQNPPERRARRENF